MISCTKIAPKITFSLLMMAIRVYLPKKYFVKFDFDLPKSTKYNTFFHQYALQFIGYMSYALDCFCSCVDLFEK